jgi:hypothetical protein
MDPTEAAMAKDMLETIREMVDAAGFRTYFVNNTLAPPGFCIHEVGTARMGLTRRPLCSTNGIRHGM